MSMTMSGKKPMDELMLERAPLQMSQDQIKIMNRAMEVEIGDNGTRQMVWQFYRDLGDDVVKQQKNNENMDMDGLCEVVADNMITFMILCKVVSEGPGLSPERMMPGCVGLTKEMIGSRDAMTFLLLRKDEFIIRAR
jgi:hypothetical protein